MAMWSPWRGCLRHSEGCKYCYIHKGDARRGTDTENIVRSENFDAPVQRKKNGEYKMKSGQTVYLCFQTDFLLPDADAWRGECWDIMRERADLNFLFLTKRIERFSECVPPDWGGGYENVTVGCTVENRQMADFRLSIFDDLPIKHKNIIAQPLLERIDIERHLKGVELVIVGGESDRNARPLDYDWVLDIREQCVRAGTNFEFRQCGTHFIKDGREYTLQVKDLASQARKANLNLGGKTR
jgi:protein gp37